MRGHYDALADALTHLEDSDQRLGVTEFATLVASFRPSVGIGRPPKTLPQETAEVLAAALRRN